MKIEKFYHKKVDHKSDFIFYGQKFKASRVRNIAKLLSNTQGQFFILSVKTGKDAAR